LHYEGWAHYTESRRDVDAAFAHAGLAERLRWLTPGRRQRFALRHRVYTPIDAGA
jgi:hypothetical protein